MLKPLVASVLAAFVTVASSAWAGHADAAKGATPATQDGGLAAPVRSVLGSAVVYLPAGFEADDDGSFDLVVHFHGGAQVIEASFVESGLNAALVTVNLGIGSGAYQSTYEDSTRLEHLMAAARSLVEKRARVRGAKVGRLALSAWSAGYGAVSRLLTQKHSVDIDAVLLADGLHAGYVNPRSREVDPLKMAPFTRFAEEAVAGDKLMAITHSSIGTLGYASTSETAAYLLSRTKTRRVEDHRQDAPGLVRSTTADQGELHVRGFGGTTKQDHCAHVAGLGQTLFPMLSRWWG